MKKTNFIPKFSTLLTGMFMFLLLLTSAPTYAQALPDMVEEDEAILRINQRFADLKTGDTGLEDYYRTKYANDADAGAVEVQLSYWLHEAVRNHIAAGKSTHDAILYVFTKDNVDMDASNATPEVLYASKQDAMRDRIVKEEIIELLKK